MIECQRENLGSLCWESSFCDECRIISKKMWVLACGCWISCYLLFGFLLSSFELSRWRVFDLWIASFHKRVRDLDIDVRNSQISKAELDERLWSIMTVTPRDGESYVRESLRGSGWRIQCCRILERLQTIETVGRAARKSRAIRRSVYNMHALNWLRNNSSVQSSFNDTRSNFAPGYPGLAKINELILSYNKLGTISCCFMLNVIPNKVRKNE